MQYTVAWTRSANQRLGVRRKVRSVSQKGAENPPLGWEGRRPKHPRGEEKRVSRLSTKQVVCSLAITVDIDNRVFREI